jgi:hypothetical protein
VPFFAFKVFRRDKAAKGFQQQNQRQGVKENLISNNLQPGSRGELVRA